MHRFFTLNNHYQSRSYKTLIIIYFVLQNRVSFRAFKIGNMWISLWIDEGEPCVESDALRLKLKKAKLCTDEYSLYLIVIHRLLFTLMLCFI